MSDKNISRFNEMIEDCIDERSYLRKLVEHSDLGYKVSESSQRLCRTLEEIRRTGDLDEMIDVEMSLLVDQIRAAMTRNPTWPEELRSVTLADEQMAKGLRCYNQLSEDIEAYQAETNLHVKSAADNYPHDSFRVFVEAQHARLQNALKMPYTESEKIVLEARDKNIKTMNRLYKALQKERLPEPVREIGELAKYRAERKAVTDQARAERKASPKLNKQSQAKQKDKGMER